MRSLASLLAALALVLTAGCGLLPEDIDETAGWSAEKLYAEARDAMDDRLYDKAIKMFEKLESRYPYGRYARQAQLETAFAHYKQDEREQAVAACDRFIRLHPNQPGVDYAWYLKGLVHFNEDLGLLARVSNQDQTERDPRSAIEAFEAFKALINGFPDSKYVEDASLRMAYLVNALAAHEVHVAEFYLRRGAWLAAVNRVQEALTNYPRAPANEKGLFIMIKAYDALGMDDLRDGAERVMRRNFPDSEYFKRGLSSGEPWWRLW